MFSNEPKTSTENSSKTNAFFSRDKKEIKTPFFTVQPKLTIGSPNDFFEKEADQKADEVVGRLSGASAHKPFSSPISSVSKVVQPAKDKEEELQLKAENHFPKNNIESSLNAQRGGGTPLDSETKTQMENAFGSDFSNVRIHTQSAANQMNQHLGSRAFATGNDIFFKSGAYKPKTHDGKKLLAHELTHTIQQNGANTKHIQGDKIRYRTIAWGDFEGVAQEGDTHDAAVHSGIKSEFSGDLVRVSYRGKGNDEYDLTVRFYRNRVSLHAEMDTEKSWKNTWLTDDDAARDKLGEDADIAAARNELLAHEQIHFKNSREIAEAYEDRLKEQVPTERFTKTITATNQEEINAAMIEFRDEKLEEVQANMDTVIQEALAELAAIQVIYDTDTNHSQNEAEQANWLNDYDDTFEAAREQYRNDTNPPQDEHVHEEEAAEPTP